MAGARCPQPSPVPRPTFRLPETATSPPDASAKAKRAEGALAPRRPGGWWRARRLTVVNVSPSRASDPEVGQIVRLGEGLRPHPVELEPPVPVPDFDPGVEADDHHLSLQVGELPQVRGQRHPTLLVGLDLAGAAEEDPSRIELLGSPLRLLADLRRHLFELLRREHRQAAALALGHEPALGELVPGVRRGRARHGTSRGRCPSPSCPGSAGTLPGTSGIPRLSELVRPLGAISRAVT